jgi:BirA family biotin operon repressor/biotin-[acetyl-CoA-carboxylase] ligase
MNWRLHHFPSLDSTNTLALQWLREGRANPGDVLLADEQTAGRGRQGRVWHSPRGMLIMTAVLPLRMGRAGWTSLAAGIATTRAVNDLGADAGVKWPNDVWLRGGKLAGILVETTGGDLAAMGLGMNVVNPLPDAARLANPPSRLADWVPHVTVEGLLERVLERLDECWELLEQPDLTPLRRLWEELDTTAGRPVRWSNNGVTGVARGVDDAGALLIETDGGRVEHAAVGEVTFL